MRRIALGVFVAALAACGQDPLPQPSVDFAIDAPLCSSLIPVSLWVDDGQVGVDTFRVNYGPSHTRTGAFATATGAHTLAVRFFPGGNLIQQDSAIWLAAGQQYTFTVGFYCS